MRDLTTEAPGSTAVIHAITLRSAEPTREEGLVFARYLDEEAEGLPALCVMVLGALLAPLLRILSTVPDEHFYLLALAVDSQCRGRGVGSKLIDHMEAQACADGSTCLTLDVAVKNDRARRLYERHGFAIRSQWPKSRLLSPVFFRMSNPL